MSSGAAYEMLNGRLVSKGYADSIRKLGKAMCDAGSLLKGKPAEQPKPTRLRQSAKPLLNKLETEWLAVIEPMYPNKPPIRSQAKTYRIANGLRYTPDFTCSRWHDENGPDRETAWEVKGKWVDGDSFPKLKMAAATWPEVQFILVWKQDGEWKQQTILP